MSREPIAVVGIGCRLPGASGPRELWRMLAEGRDAIREVPSDRFDVDALYHETPATPGRIMSRWGGFLDDIDRFDAQFFGLSPREADRLDPQQRLLLEVGWEALEDAGQSLPRPDGAQTGVFVGMWLNDYEARLFRNPRAIDFYMTTGTGRYSASGRLSYVFGFEGPSMTIDCACSSSLVAVHLACNSLWSGESKMALAGGANVILEPNITIAYSQSRMMAPDGRCKFGDASADGYVRSEGAAIVVLKPLSAALANGDPIYALIRGSAVNNDGRSSGFLATPGQAGQETMLRRAYADAGVDPSAVQYVEAHGTGTRAGDPVEIGAIGAVLGTGRPADAPCRVGSIKTNVGHTEGASGVAGLIKVALSLSRGSVPPSLHCQQPNPAIPWDRLGVQVQRALEPWRPGPVVAGVSSFGIAGTNAHVVLEQFTGRPAVPRADDRHARTVVLSAQTPDALKATARSWHSFVSDDASGASMADIAYTAAVRRTHHDHRLAVTAADPAELASELDLFVRGEPSAAVTAVRNPERERKVVFVFPGQGSQWLGMGRSLLEREPVFRDAMAACDAAVRNETGWSVLSELHADEPRSRFDRIDVIQPVLFSLQVALAALWRSWGVEPSAVIGHSMGEVAAACVAGALTIDDAARVICRRSLLLRRTSGTGAMAVVGLSFDKAADAIDAFKDQLSIAVSNSPRSTVISGDPGALDEVLAQLERRDVFCRRVNVDVASHSPQMDPLRADLLAQLKELKPRPATLAICSTVLASMTDGAGFDAAYWVRNLRQPVLFSRSVQGLIADGHDTFVEISPHPLLTSAVQELLQDSGADGIVVGSLRRDDDEVRAIGQAIATVWAAGGPIDLARVYPDGRFVALPGYPWQRERHWLDTVPGRGAFAGARSQSLPGSRLQSPIPSFELELSAAADAWIGAAQVAGAPVVPQGAWLAIASAAALDHLGGKAAVIEQVTFGDAVPVPAEATLTFQTVVPRLTTDAASFSIHHLVDPNATASGFWKTVASGEIRRASAEGSAAASFADAQRICTDQVSGTAFYGALAARGVDIREDARVVREVWSAKDERVGALALTGTGGTTGDAWVWQSCFDLMATLPASPDEFIWVAEQVAHVSVVGQLAAASWCHVSIQPGDRAATARGRATLYTDSGEALAVLDGIALRRVRPSAYAGSHRLHTAGWTYALTWERETADPAGAVPPADALARTWIVLGGNAVADAVAHTVLERGGSAVLVTSGERFSKHGDDRYEIDITDAADYERLLHDVTVPLAGIIHMLAADVPDATSADTLEAQTRTLTLSTILAAQAVERSNAGRLWIVTRGAQAIDGSSKPALGQSPSWGIARVLELEARGTFGGVLDLDPEAHASDAARDLTDFISVPGGERQVVSRRNVRYVPRLVSAPAPLARTLSIRGGDAYLVTGGLGRLGLEVARWLADQGAGHVVLAGRRGLPPRDAWATVDPSSDVGGQIRAIRAIEERGTDVTVHAADTADERAMRDLFSRFGTTLPRLRGVVHAAGRIDYRALDQIGERDVDDVLRAKVRGTWVLHELTAQLRDPLDFFVLFSSGASVWGSRHLAHYAGANHALDAVAAYRRAEGLPALAINWGWWEGGATTAESDALFAQAGLQAMAPDAALEVMADLLGTDVAQRVIAAIDWTVFRPAYESTGSRLLARIDAAAPAVAVGRARGSLLRELASLSGDETKARVTEYLRSEVGAVLGRDPSQLDPARGFFKLGMDSLMTVELRRRLETALDRALPTTIAFEYPTISALSAYICSEVLYVKAAPSAPGASAAAVSAVSATAIQAALEERSVDELASMLDDELAHLLGNEGRPN